MSPATLELALAPAGHPLPSKGVVWSDDPAVSHFKTNLDVALAGFGPSLVANRDFVRIGVAVKLADRAHRRPRAWERHLKVVVPVEEPDPWRTSLGDLETLLRFLTGDSWQVELTPADIGPQPDPPDAIEADHYMLLSGGADSLSGALVLGSAERTCLVSHSDAGQPAARGQLRCLWGKPPQSQSGVVQLRGGGPNGLAPKEDTSRSRSLLFFGLDLLAASSSQKPLLVPENGFASLNPPLAPERAGSHSTRTTHPRYMADLRDILQRVGAHHDLSNPFAGRTKGEMFDEAARKWGAQAAAEALSASISCAKRTGLRVKKTRGTNHCGLCYGCLVRRGAFRAAGLTDATLYCANPTDAVGTPGRWHTQRGRTPTGGAVATCPCPRGAAVPGRIRPHHRPR